MSFDREATVGKWIIKRKATPNHPLSKEDEKRNSEIEVIRRHVEKAFGNVKQIFGILRNDYIDAEENGSLLLLLFALELRI